MRKKAGQAERKGKESEEEEIVIPSI